VDRAQQAPLNAKPSASGGNWMSNKRFATVAAVAVMLAGGSYRASSANGPSSPQQNEKINHTSLKPGDMAPDFTLLDNNWKKVHLSDFRGKKNVVLAFYVLAFTGG
jgi:cytochrome oxidase Cu insertion factor (SCO1/SenC/PrrC family)